MVFHLFPVRSSAVELCSGITGAGCNVLHAQVSTCSSQDAQCYTSSLPRGIDLTEFLSKKGNQFFRFVLQARFSNK